MKDLLKKLTLAYGPSANEKAVADIIKAEICDYVDEIKQDNLGNLIAVKKGNGRKIMLSSPLDQICFLITHIQDDGHIKFAPLGRVETEGIVNSRIVFENGVQGIIAREKYVDLRMENLYITIGAKSLSEVQEKLSIGDAAILKGEYFETSSSIIAAGLDGRACCSCLVDVIKDWPEDIKDEVYFVFSCQSMLGARGSKVASFAIKPDIGISIDAAEADGLIKMGAGPVIRVRDKSMTSYPELIVKFEEAAKNENIPLQRQVELETISDVAGIHEAGIDTPVISIALPVENFHSASEIIDKQDYDNIKRLLVEALKRL